MTVKTGLTQPQPAKQAQVQPIALLTAKAFTGGQYLDAIVNEYVGNCHYDWETTRLIWDGDQLVHHWGVWGYLMRVEFVKLKIAGVGAVATDEAYRKQGLMQQAAQASFDAMYQQGYDLSILRGRHYVKYGYARAWNYITYRLKPEEIPPALPDLAYQALDTSHIPAVDAVYNQTHQLFCGTAIRPTYRRKSAEEMSAYGWFDEAGQLAGYIRAQPVEDDPETLQCLEAAGDPGQSLAVLGELFRNGGYKALTLFTLPPQHPLLQLVRRDNCIVETRYFATSGWRVRIVNLHNALGKIRPLLATRLRESSFAGWKGRLMLDAGEQKATLLIERSAVRVEKTAPADHCINGGAGIGRLLIGSDDPGEIIRQEDMICSGDAAQLAQVLFPNLYPMLSQWDEV